MKPGEISIAPHGEMISCRNRFHNLSRFIRVTITDHNRMKSNMTQKSYIEMIIMCEILPMKSGTGYLDLSGQVMPTKNQIINR